MISYKDRSFCSAECGVMNCPIKLTQQVYDAAEMWWTGGAKPFGDKYTAPIAISDFSKECKDFKPIKKEEDKK